LMEALPTGYCVPRGLYDGIDAKLPDRGHWFREWFWGKISSDISFERQDLHAILGSFGSRESRLNTCILSLLGVYRDLLEIISELKSYSWLEG
jgi:hypothetical protein